MQLRKTATKNILALIYPASIWIGLAVALFDQTRVVVSLKKVETIKSVVEIVARRPLL